MVTRPALALFACGLAACVPELTDRSFLITEPTLLAISSTPAEAAPPASVSFKALYVGPNGETTAPLSWAFCTAREALTDEGTVSPDCLASGGSNLVSIGSGLDVKGALPADGCRLFGPNPPDPLPGQPAERPVDPDGTGGFYQPVRLLVDDGASPTAIGATRIACGLSGAPTEVGIAFTADYRFNQAPAVASLSVVHADGTSDVVPNGGGAGAKVTAGEQVTLHATWASCPTTPVCGDGVCSVDETVKSCPKDCTHPVGCTGSETYLLFDPEARALTTAREAIRVAWYATGGSLADDTDGQSAADAATASVDNAWTAPTTSGSVLLWLVIRDDRGGVAWQSYAIDVD